MRVFTALSHNQNLIVSSSSKYPKSTHFPSHIIIIFIFIFTHSLLLHLLPLKLCKTKRTKMASTACFLHHHSLSTPARSTTSQRHVSTSKPSLVVCRAQKQAVQDEDVAVVSRRLALTVLIGAAAIGTKVSPADAAYGEAGTFLSL